MILPLTPKQQVELEIELEDDELEIEIEFESIIEEKRLPTNNRISEKALTPLTTCKK